MAWPSFRVEVAFDTPGTQIPGEWTDVTEWVRGFTVSGGRQHELDRMEATTATLTLDNRDRRFEPENDASPYSPWVIPTRRVRIIAALDVWEDEWHDDWDDTEYRVFEGFVESWPPEYPGGQDSTVQVRLVDGTKLIALADVTESAPSESSGARINRLLDAADWPAGSRDVDAGQSQVSAVDYDAANVLSAIRDVEGTEDGIFYIAGDGRATFRDRTARVDAEVEMVFSRDDEPFQVLEPDFGDSQLWNRVVIDPTDLDEQSADDAGSQSQHGRRRFVRRTLHTTTAEAQDHADGLLARLASPRLRFDRLGVNLRGSPTLLDAVLSLRFGSRVTVVHHPPPGDTAVEREVYVEHITHEVAARSWVTRLETSPVAPEAFWLIGVPGFSEIGMTTRVGW